MSLTPEQRRGWVLTPHPGEMGRLIDRPPQWVNAHRGTVGQELASSWGVTVLLKGAPTVVSGQAEYILVQPETLVWAPLGWAMCSPA